MNKHSRLRILQLSTSNVVGADYVAFHLHEEYLARGYDAHLLVKYKKKVIPGNLNGIIEIDAYMDTLPWAPMLSLVENFIASRPRFRGQERLRDGLRQMVWPKRWWDRHRGYEDFNYHYTRKLLNESDWKPDIIHVHNLHGNYFDLTALEQISQNVPVFVTLHDAWMLTGHCAYPIHCDRWQSGCGSCPDLKRYPQLRVDNTHKNWLRKKGIYEKSRLYIATPSNWLMGLVDQSMLKSIERRVIPIGLNHLIFRTVDDPALVRRKLGLPEDNFICLFVSMSGANKSPYKDYNTIEHAIDLVLDKFSGEQKILFVIIGGKMKKKEKSYYVKHLGYVGDKRLIAKYYQAADVFLHAAHADNLPLTVIEAQLCGTPVIATAVGGITEEIREGQTGFLVPPGDSVAIADRILRLMSSDELRVCMGKEAANFAKKQFDSKKQYETYLDWYQEVLDKIISEKSIEA